LAGGKPCLRELLRQAAVEIFLRAAPILSGEPLGLSIPHARNFVLCFKYILKWKKYH